MAKEKTLVLRPTLHDFDRAGIENYLTIVRAKRMAATVEFFQTKNRKLELRQEALGERYAKGLEMLDKEIARLEAAEAKVDARLAMLQELENEYNDTGNRVTEVSDA